MKASNDKLGDTAPWTNSIVRVLSGGLAADSAIVYLLGDTVLQVSPPDYPHVIREMTAKADLAREKLGPDLARPIPNPLGEWEINGVSCALFEKFNPISSNRLIRIVQRRKLSGLVLAWLRGVSAVDGGPNVRAIDCIAAMADCPSEFLQFAAQKALAAVKSRRFEARSRVMHGDLWVGNVLLDPSGEREFIIIDWRGSEADGFPIFDLVRFAGSLGLSSRALRIELAAHAERLGCALQDTRTYLLAALGHIWMNLDQFPAERFAAMGDSSLRRLDSALA